MKTRELVQFGIPEGKALKIAKKTLAFLASTGVSKNELRSTMQAVCETPENYLEDNTYGQLSAILIEEKKKNEAAPSFIKRETPAPFQKWGTKIDQASIDQMTNACQLPVAVAGALMPDAHVGYGLPIGGVLATKNSVIPYAVGMDIACRMKMTVLDLPVSMIHGEEGRLRKAIQAETRFGMGSRFENPKDHAVMDEDWSFTTVTKKSKDKAWTQLGSSGSGNHFVEFGVLTFDETQLGLEAGTYVALLSHSGSRGVGGSVAQFYSQLARELHPELPKHLTNLAWLDLGSETGQEYWKAMELMGRYAAANHELIHRDIAKFLKADILLDVENHHNFAWKETHKGEEVIVHRKGATPANEGVLGIIPGSMATPGYLVQGLGNPASLHSASHGAGRKMSRKDSRNSFTWNAAKKFLAERAVVLISAGLDEVPMSYKDIETVMSSQKDLVQPLARFDPKLVKMAPDGEKAED